MTSSMEPEGGAGCAPEIIDWSKVGGFRYASSRNAPEYSDLNFEAFLESTSGGSVDLAVLKRRHASCVDNDGNVLEEWPIYRCTYCELGPRGSNLHPQHGSLVPESTMILSRR